MKCFHVKKTLRNIYKNLSSYSENRFEVNKRIELFLHSRPNTDKTRNKDETKQNMSTLVSIVSK